MPSEGYVNGADFGIFVDNDLIAVAMDNQLQLTRNMIEVSNKDTPGDAEYIPGRGDGTASGNARLKYDAGFGYSDLFAIYNNRTKVTIRYSNGEAGDDEYTFEAYLTELNRQDTDNEIGNVDYTFQKTGAITESAVPA